MVNGGWAGRQIHLFHDVSLWCYLLKHKVKYLHFICLVIDFVNSSQCWNGQKPLFSRVLAAANTRGTIGGSAELIDSSNWFCSLWFCSLCFCSLWFCSHWFCSLSFCSYWICSLWFHSLILLSLVLFSLVLFLMIMFSLVLFPLVLYCHCAQRNSWRDHVRDPSFLSTLRAVNVSDCWDSSTQ